MSERPTFIALFEGWCALCHTIIDIGDSACYDDEKNVVHVGCVEDDDE